MIPLSIPNLGAAERDAVAKAVETGWVSSAGPDIKEFERQIAAYCGTRFAVATSSGTAALHLALAVLGAGPNDLVIAPNLTFVASINAIRYTGAEPVLVDADLNGMAWDLPLIAKWLEENCIVKDNQCYFKGNDKRIVAAMPMHILGYASDMGVAMALFDSYGIAVIEDAAEALGTFRKGKHAGTHGQLGCLSFNGNKIITTGGGGMVITDDQRLAEYVRHLSTQAKAFADEFLHDEVGYNYRMPNLNAAMGIAQLARLPEFLARKRDIHGRYRTGLREIAQLRPAQYHEAADHAPNFWLNAWFSTEARQLEEYLLANGIQTRKLWVPMNRLPMYRDAICLGGGLRSHDLYEQSILLPSSTGLTDAEQSEVIAAVRAFFSPL